jgi:hypothetical protein
MEKMGNRGEIVRIKEQYKEAILAKPNVVGVGTGYKVVGGVTSGNLCIMAMVSKKIPRAGLDPDALVPSELDGVRTDVLQVGVLQAHGGRLERNRPLVGGISIGHYKVTAGTLGGVVRDRESGERFILSNNHVMANSNDAQIGDPILQPGAADGGRADEDTVAHLEKFRPIRFNVGPATCGVAKGFEKFGNAMATLFGSKHKVKTFFNDPEASNIIDAALARPLSEEILSDEILDIGILSGITSAQLGQSVRKSGRTTGYTMGIVTILDATVDIQYGERVARYEDQIVTDGMSSPGDSGSLLVAADSLLAIGLLFAGSDQATIYNPINLVLDQLGVVL